MGDDDAARVTLPLPPSPRTRIIAGLLREAAAAEAHGHTLMAQKLRDRAAELLPRTADDR